MRLLITGGTGFLGKALCEYLHPKGHQITVLTRNKDKARKRVSNPDIVLITDLMEVAQQSFDGVINLAGAPIAKKWSARYRNTIVKSRVDYTEQLVLALKQLKKPPTVFISGSAVGYYGPHGEEALHEGSKPNSSFSHQLCEHWERAASLAANLHARVCYIRTGIVLGNGGGALARMRWPFIIGLGGKLGHGDQWMSWVHLQDYLRIIEFCLENDQIEGPVNATAPNPVNNKTFTKVYGQVLNRPTIWPNPGWLLKLLYGQMAEELLLTGQKVIPKKLLEHDFHFDFDQLPAALTDIESRR